MTVGYISAQFEPIIPLTIRNDVGGSMDTEAVLDTGFNGWLMLTPPIIAQLQLTLFDTAKTILADGQIVSTDLYIVRVVWQGTERIIIADSGMGSPPVGMVMLQDLRVTMDVHYNGEVSIAPIP
jgi:clan AA aspartic protease